ncbi:MAG: hypothetical protein NZL93_07175, partial [Chthoniobacterales bacterium]|nr:hypothetical protein [Chthoniobacterales bacterium]
IFLVLCFPLGGLEYFVNSKIRFTTLTLVSLVLTSCGSRQAGLITSNVVNPNDIAAISKFRSCCGHTYRSSGEPDCSMKTYLRAKSVFGNSTNQVKIYAPFDGEVISINESEHRIDCYGVGTKQGSQIEIAPYARPDLKVRLFHVIPIVSVGKVVRSGEHIAYADLRGCVNGSPSGPSDFDVSVEGTLNRKLPYFDYLSDSALQAWINRGLSSREAASIGRSQREADPCVQFGGAKCTAETIFFP